jgi:hypothetical protein
MENAGFYFFSNATRARRALREAVQNILDTTTIAPPREQAFLTPDFQTAGRSAVGGYHTDKIYVQAEAVFPHAGGRPLLFCASAREARERGGIHGYGRTYSGIERLPLWKYTGRSLSSGAV